MQRTRPKHGRRSYISVGIGGDTHSLLEREPLRSKDSGLLSYNIDIEEMLLDPSVCYIQLTCDLPFVSNRHARCMRTQNIWLGATRRVVVSSSEVHHHAP